jgi:S1-C subfamily serine protease
MSGRLVPLVLASLLAPAFVLAVPRPPEPRLHPRNVSPLPSFVQRVEPAIVALQVKAAPEAPSSARLGAQRFGTGTIFDDRGYAITVSYVVVDARSIEAQTRDGRKVPAQLVGLDLESGVGVVKLQAAGPWPVARLGQSRDTVAGALTGTVGVDEDNDLVWVASSVRDIRRFSASWEYMLERGLVVAPGSPSWSGNAVVNESGELIGIASLRLGEPPYVNMVIPIETFVPVKDELIAAGRAVSRRARPWIGLYTSGREGGGVVVDGFAPTGPARTTGLREGDHIVRVNGVTVRSQEEFYEQLWRGEAGDIIRLGVHRDGAIRDIAVPSMDRYRLYRPLGN